MRSWTKTGYIATYRGEYHVESLEECVITVQDFWSTITRYIKVENADRLVMRLEGVEVLNSRVIPCQGWIVESPYDSLPIEFATRYQHCYEDSNFDN